jgi:hypothetical protein
MMRLTALVRVLRPADIINRFTAICQALFGAGFRSPRLWPKLGTTQWLHRGRGQPGNLAVAKWGYSFISAVPNWAGETAKRERSPRGRWWWSWDLPLGNCREAAMNARKAAALNDRFIHQLRYWITAGGLRDVLGRLLTTRDFALHCLTDQIRWPFVSSGIEHRVDPRQCLDRKTRRHLLDLE